MSGVPLSALAAADAVINELIWKYCSGIGPTLLIYDYFLTLGSDVEYVWNRPWSIVKFLYVVSRYSPIVDAALVPLYRSFILNPSPEACYRWMSAECYVAVVGMGVSESIFFIRTWAVWERRRSIGITLFLVALMLGAGFYGTVEYAQSVKFVTGVEIGGCILYSTSNSQIISWSLLLFTDFILLALVVAKMWHDYRNMAEMLGLAKTVLMCSISYFVVLLCLSIVNLVAAGQNRPGNAETLVMVNMPTRALHSILASRMFLHIREVGSRTIIDGEESITLRTMKMIVFAPATARQEADDFDMAPLTFRENV
ncbi:hypothetical protein HYDPIDRAFT_110801 [Hydnomerulius pinastri MD-312]|nr:hypothetical protein HYDPIDRAFT_110801 [Hydnomerulius pinastri MD-312]